MRCSDVAARILTALVSAVFACATAAQQPYPSRPIHFIVPFPPGGSTDPMARMAAQKLSDRWGQPVIVENRPGGNTIIGTEAVAKALPDGYTILLISSPFVINPSFLPSLPYNAVKDFDAVATIAKSRNILVVHPSIPANTLQEFIALAKSKPGKLNYASAGRGGNTHLVGELFNSIAGTQIQNIPYKGSGALMSDLVSGQIELSFQVPISVLSHIRSGKLKPIAITGETRSSALPQVPTFTEAGMPGFELTGWFGIAAPAGTPKDVIDKTSSEMAAILALSDVQEFLVKQGSEALISTPEQVTALIKADIAKYARIIKAANIRIEE
jgi:tripartite-type tricarboxylate transporter receptor subunit TctC